MESYSPHLKYEMARLDTEKVTIGLLAALKMLGVEFIVNQADDHQIRFAKVAEAIRHKKEQEDGAVKRIPTLYPSPVLGVFHDFDQALVELQSIGITHCVGPFFTHTNITLSEERAKRTLERFTDEEQALFLELAHVFNPDLIE